MLELILNHRIDAAAFNALLVTVAVSVHFGLRRRHARGITRLSWGALGVLLVAAALLPELASQRERAGLRDMVAGIAPTYAQELSLMGHSRIGLDTSPEDPLYLAMIDAQIRWERANANVSDIYTFRKRGDGSLVLLVDAETDYNRDGIYEGEREQRTAIGEEYGNTLPSLEQAFEGIPNFDDEPVSDRWGTWVSANVPMYGADGSVEAVLGVDYDATQWLSAIALSRVAALGLVSILAVIWLSWSVVVVVTRAELAKRVAAEREREGLHRQLVDASRQAGMAEVATDVLHNVGNVLNSVNVSAEILVEKLAASRVGALGKAVGMLAGSDEEVAALLTTDPRGKLLPNYLTQLADVLAKEREAMRGELVLLRDNINHIKEIVAAQQDLARRGYACETFELDAILDDAIRINAPSLKRHRIEILRDARHCPPVTTDRHKVLQILVNLIANAKNALADAAEGDRRIEISANHRKGDCEPVAHIRVADSGAGIASEHLPKIFNHGFTTRSNGHGFGLHSAALAAKQMNGTLSAASDGPGKGATFTLTLPLDGDRSPSSRS